MLLFMGSSGQEVCYMVVGQYDHWEKRSWSSRITVAIRVLR